MNVDEMEAGREMDALVAEKVMGLPKVELGGPCPKCGGETRIGINRAWCYHEKEWIYSPYPEYSTDIAMAWKVLEKFIPPPGDKAWTSYIRSPLGSRHLSHMSASEAALTICREALKAMGL